MLKVEMNSLAILLFFCIATMLLQTTEANDGEKDNKGNILNELKYFSRVFETRFQFPYLLTNIIIVTVVVFLRLKFSCRIFCISVVKRLNEMIDKKNYLAIISKVSHFTLLNFKHQ